MLQLIISIISSSGCRSGNEWHASASLDMRHSGLNEWWNEARWEKNKTASWEKKAKEWRKKKLWMSAKVTGECTISYNSELNPTKKKKKRQQREKLHSNGHETIDFIEKDCWKSKHNFSRSWQVLCLIIVFRAAAEFILLSLYLCDTSHQLAKNKKT